MEKKLLPVLRITNIEWEQNAVNETKLPKQLALKWNSDNYSNAEVLDWLSAQYNTKLKSIKIDRSGSWKSSGGG